MRILLLVLSISFLLSSCKIYQIYDTNSDQVNVVENQGYKFENDEVIIYYDLWKEGGALSFLIFNKSDKPIYIDWKKSNFITNNLSLDYWNDEERTTTITNSKTKGSDAFLYNPQTNTGVSVGSSNTTSISSSIKVKAKPDIQIPPKSMKPVYVFDLSQNYLSYKRNTAQNNKSETIEYTKSNSPFTFRNYIAYSFDKDLNSLKFIDNEFYVSKVEIMTDHDFKSKYPNTSTSTKHKYYCSSKDQKRTNEAYLIGCGSGIAFCGLTFFLPVFRALSK
jgi:hypothetical protein